MYDLVKGAFLCNCKSLKDVRYKDLSDKDYFTPYELDESVLDEMFDAYTV